MGREISLFSGYDQKENRTTNYCLLMLRQVYEASPRLLAKVLENLVGHGIEGLVGVQFSQQTRKGGSVPDAAIVQQPFRLYVETKNSDWFYWEQLSEHLKSLSDSGQGLNVLVALSNFEEKDEAKFEEFERRCREEFESVRLVTASFEDLLDALDAAELPLSLEATKEDFRQYLEGQGLLPRWRRYLEVVNCVSTMHEVDAGGYLCPATGGSYWHSRARLFGPYRHKRVTRVYELDGVVDIYEESEHVHWDNRSEATFDLKVRARMLAEQFRAHDLAQGVRVLLLGESAETDIEKESKGGMLGTKRYFDIPEGTLQEIADFLRGKTWHDLRGY